MHRYNIASQVTAPGSAHGHPISMHIVVGM